MKKTAVFDIEATNWVNFACLGFFDGEEYQVYWSVEHFLENFLTKKYRGFNCFAHFGGKYDFRFLIPYLIEDGRYTLKFLERNSKILSIKVIDNKRRYSWKFSDSYFLLPASLKELGKNFKIQYMKLDFDVENEKDFKSEKAQAYLRNDCLGLYEIIEKFSNWGLNGGKLKLTLPSQSLHVFTSRFLKDDLVILSPAQEEFVRKTYFGGRVEIFKLHGEGLYYYDFNSLYPTVMLEEMPIGRPVQVFSYHENLIGFYKIKADIPTDTLIPPLPVIAQGKLFFPMGEGEFYTTSAEVELLKERGIKFQVLDGLIFEEKKAIFKEYIETMYKIRQRTDKGTLDNFVAKLMMNSLYGKFGQRRDNEELIFSTQPEEGWTPYDEEYGLYLTQTESKSRYILPYLASYITSLARARLYRTFTKLGFENVWYCDTDSVITNKVLATGEGLGELKLEHEILEAVFLQPKAYAMKTKAGEIVKVKGMKDIKVGLKEFIISLKNKNVEGINSTYYNIMGFRETIKRNKNMIIKRHKVFKKLNSIYDKRIVKNHLTFPFNFSSINTLK